MVLTWFGLGSQSQLSFDSGFDLFSQLRRTIIGLIEQGEIITSFIVSDGTLTWTWNLMRMKEFG